MSSDGQRSKRYRAGGTEGALTLVAGVAVPSRGGAVPTLTLTNTNIDTNSEGRNQPGLFQDDQWQDVFIPVSVEDAPLNGHDGSYAESRKRRRPPSFGEASDVSQWLRINFPELGPGVLQLPARSWAPDIVNPFLEQQTRSHPRLRRYTVPVAIPEDGYIDGLIKVRLNMSRYQQKFPTARLQRFSWKKPQHAAPVVDQAVQDGLARLPPDFGRGLKLTGMNEKLFEFYRIAICGAVTLIKADNCYLQEIIPIAVKSDCVKHAILALAATYILNYSGEEKVKTQANLHWKRAVHFLSRELQATEKCKPGKENAVLAAMVLFSHNENVNWEATDSGNESPPWSKATDIAERVLEMSDPLYNYHSPSNVQCSRARITLGNRIALYNIMSAMIYPLDEYQARCSFTWLLEGSERELHKIVGCTGLCPKLMHTFAQITHLSTKLYKDPNRIAARNLAKVIGERLENFEQYSDLSDGYPTSQALLDSCELDENGKIFTAVKTTELLAESYVATAQIYLYCRLMRKSRKHPHVQSIVDRLLWIIDRMATSGPHFTAAHAQVRVFVGAIVAVEQRHRDIVRAWFEDLVHGTRGNVPPVWRTIQYMWEWLDAKYRSSEATSLDTSDVTLILPNAEPWWEDLVAEVHTREGKLNLA